MANTGFISMAPLIAGVQTVVNATGVMVTAIHDVDLPAVDTVVDAIRAVDVPALQAKIFRGSTKVEWDQRDNAALGTVIDLTGPGKVLSCCFYLRNNSGFRLTVDGVVGTEFDNGDAAGTFNVEPEHSSSGAEQFGYIADGTSSVVISVEFKTQFLVEMHSDAGGFVSAKVLWVDD